MHAWPKAQGCCVLEPPALQGALLAKAAMGWAPSSSAAPEQSAVKRNSPSRLIAASMLFPHDSRMSDRTYSVHGPDKQISRLALKQSSNCSLHYTSHSTSRRTTSHILELPSS